MHVSSSSSSSRQNHTVNPGERGGEGARAEKSFAQSEFVDFGSTTEVFILVTVVVGVERRGRVSRALPRWWSQSLPLSVTWTQNRTRRPQQHTQNLRKIRGCKKIPGAEYQELRVLEARRNRKNTVQRTYVSKQTESTPSTLVAVQARCNTMTPVAPVLQLSSEAYAIVAAINGALAPRLDGIQGDVGGTNDEFEI